MRTISFELFQRPQLTKREAECPSEDLFAAATLDLDDLRDMGFVDVSDYGDDPYIHRIH